MFFIFGGGAGFSEDPGFGDTEPRGLGVVMLPLSSVGRLLLFFCELLED